MRFVLYLNISWRGPVKEEDVRTDRADRKL